MPKPAPVEVLAPRRMSLTQVHRLLNRDRNTVAKWLEKDGAPYVQRGSKERGVAWIIDIADLVRWLEARAAEEVAGRIPASGEADSSKDEADRRKAWAQALRAELEYAEAKGEVVRKADALAVVAAEYADVREALDGLPTAAAVDLAAMNDPGAVEAYLREKLAEALSSLRGDVGASVDEVRAAQDDDD